MERKTQQISQKTEQKQEHKRDEARRHRTPGPSSSLALQAVLDGAELWDMPYQSLSELAGQVGNSGMLALMAMGAPQADTCSPPLGVTESSAPYFPVPDGLECQTAACPGLAGSWPAAAVDPALLA